LNFTLDTDDICGIIIEMEKLEQYYIDLDRLEKDLTEKQEAYAAAEKAYIKHKFRLAMVYDTTGGREYLDGKLIELIEMEAGDGNT